MTKPPTSTADLSPTEQRFLTEMGGIVFGRFEHLQIERGQLVLNPLPTAIRSVRFGGAGMTENPAVSDHFELKAVVAEFFAYVRRVDDGEIVSLAIKHGLPVAMEIARRQAGGKPRG